MSRAGAAMLAAAVGVAAVAGSADLELLDAVREVSNRLDRLGLAAPDGAPVAERADAAAQAAAASARVRAALDPARLGARGRAWEAIGLGLPDDPRKLRDALALDLDGVGLDVAHRRILVGPELLPDGDFRVEGQDDAASTVLLATGVRPDEVLVAHELVHLRQLERTGVDALAETTEATLSRAARREGEANLVGMLYLFAAMGLQQDVVEHGLSPDDVLDGRLVPRGAHAGGDLVAALLDFVYRDGFSWARERLKGGGISGLAKAVDAAEGTREIVEPARSNPATAPAPDPDPDAPRGFVVVDRDVVGHRGIVALVAAATGKDNLALIAADGWLGDTLFRLECPDRPTSEGRTVWVTHWTGAEAARDFEYGLERAVAARCGADAMTRDAGDPESLSCAAGGLAFALERRAATVTLKVVPADSEG